MEMSKKPRFIDNDSTAHSNGRLAVIDIGSSMIRLVVYDDGSYPHLYLNHKTWTALAKGKSADKDFYLDKEPVERTISAISWFKWVCSQARVTRIICTATSAVREAKNGGDFVKQVKERTGIHVEVISGEYEARLSASGAISSIPKAKGVVVDLGGGSLDLCETDTKGEYKSLPLGVLTLQEMSGNNPLKAVDILRKSLKEVNWLTECKTKDLVALGAGMRSIASLHMMETNYPMHILHDYVIEKETALDFCEQFIKGTISCKIAEQAKDYLDVLPYRAAALYALLKETKLKQVRFASFGLREGLLFSELGEDVMNGDPLIAFAKDMAIRDGRGEAYALHLADWVHEIMPDVEPRIIQAASMFADISWREQLAYRATTAFETVYGGSYVACSHKERGILSLMAYFAHEQKLDESLQKRLPFSISEEDINQAKIAGALFYLARLLDPGAKGLLSDFILEKNAKGEFELKGPESFMMMASETIDKHLSLINKLMK